MQLPINGGPKLPKLAEGHCCHPEFTGGPPLCLMVNMKPSAVFEIVFYVECKGRIII